MSFKSTFDPKAVQKKHKEIERKFNVISQALSDAGIDDPEINDILALHFSSQCDKAINYQPFIDTLGSTVTEPENA